MSISFNDIPSNLRVPLTYIEIDNSRAVSGTPAMPYKILLLGQTSWATSTGAVEVWPEPVLFTRKEDADVRCGFGSQLALMVKAALGVNPGVEVWALGVDGAGNAPQKVGSIEFSGEPSVSSVLKLSFWGYEFSVPVSINDGVYSLIEALVEMINNDPHLPFSAAINDEGSVPLLDIKSKWFDQTVLDIDLLRVLQSVPGLNVINIEPDPEPLNPDIRWFLDVLGDEQYQIIVSPWYDTTTLADLNAELLSRFGPQRMIDGLLFTAGLAPDSDPEV